MDSHAELKSIMQLNMSFDDLVTIFKGESAETQMSPNSVGKPPKVRSLRSLRSLSARNVYRAPTHKHGGSPQIINHFKAVFDNLLQSANKIYPVPNNQTRARTDQSQVLVIESIIPAQQTVQVQQTVQAHQTIFEFTEFFGDLHPVGTAVEVWKRNGGPKSFYVYIDESGSCLLVENEEQREQVKAAEPEQTSSDIKKTMSTLFAPQGAEIYYIDYGWNILSSGNDLQNVPNFNDETNNQNKLYDYFINFKPFSKSRLAWNFKQSTTSIGQITHTAELTGVNDYQIPLIFSFKTPFFSHVLNVSHVKIGERYRMFRRFTLPQNMMWIFGTTKFYKQTIAEGEHSIAWNSSYSTFPDLIFPFHTQQQMKVFYETTTYNIEATDKEFTDIIQPFDLLRSLLPERRRGDDEAQSLREGGRSKQVKYFNSGAKYIDANGYERVIYTTRRKGAYIKVLNKETKKYVYQRLPARSKVYNNK